MRHYLGKPYAEEELLALIARYRPRSRGGGVTQARWLAAALLALALAAPAAQAQPLVDAAVDADSSEATAAPYQSLDIDWYDAARQRAVPVRLYLPARASAAQRVPLVVFSHGIGGSRRGYSYLGSHWASHGVASLHLQHVGSDRSLWQGNPVSLVLRLQGAAQESEAIARVQDLRFALDQLAAGPHAQAIDMNRVVAAGHSYGANTTLPGGGARRCSARAVRWTCATSGCAAPS